jgi:hypothetical protein
MSWNAEAYVAAFAASV